MKRMLMSTLLLGCFCSLALGQTTTAQNGTPEQQIRFAESELFRAYSSHNMATLKALLGDNLSFTKENGYVSSKATEIRLQANLEQKKSINVSESDAADLGYQVRRMQAYGDAVVTTGSIEERDNTGKAVRFHFTNTWVKQEGKWQVVAIQITTVTPEVQRNLAKMAKQ